MPSDPPIVDSGSGASPGTPPSVKGTGINPASLLNLLVSGAGSAGANGNFLLTGTLNGRNTWQQGNVTISWTGSEWRFIESNGGGLTILYQSSDDVQNPSLISTWDAIGETTPYPTIATAGVFPPPQPLA